MLPGRERGTTTLALVDGPPAEGTTTPSGSGTGTAPYGLSVVPADARLAAFFNEQRVPPEIQRRIVAEAGPNPFEHLDTLEHVLQETGHGGVVAQLAEHFPTEVETARGRGTGPAEDPARRGGR